MNVNVAILDLAAWIALACVALGALWRTTYPGKFQTELETALAALLALSAGGLIGLRLLLTVAPR